MHSDLEQAGPLDSPCSCRRKVQQDEPPVDGAVSPKVPACLSLCSVIMWARCCSCTSNPSACLSCSKKALATRLTKANRLDMHPHGHIRGFNTIVWMRLQSWLRRSFCTPYDSCPNSNVQTRRWIASQSGTIVVAVLTHANAMLR